MTPLSYEMNRTMHRKRLGSDRLSPALQATQFVGAGQAWWITHEPPCAGTPRRSGRRLLEFDRARYGTDPAVTAHVRSYGRLHTAKAILLGYLRVDVWYTQSVREFLHPPLSL